MMERLPICWMTPMRLQREVWSTARTAPPSCRAFIRLASMPLACGAGTACTREQCACGRPQSPTAWRRACPSAGKRSGDAGRHDGRVVDGARADVMPAFRRSPTPSMRMEKSTRVLPAAKSRTESLSNSALLSSGMSPFMPYLPNWESFLRSLPVVDRLGVGSALRLVDDGGSLCGACGCESCVDRALRGSANDGGNVVGLRALSRLLGGLFLRLLVAACSSAGLCLRGGLFVCPSLTPCRSS